MTLAHSGSAPGVSRLSSRLGCGQSPGADNNGLTPLDSHRVNPSSGGWRRVVNATLNSWAGLKGVWRNEAAFRQESVLCLCLTPVGLWLGRSGVERALLVGSLLLVMIVELLNSGLEAVVDRIGPEWHELSRLAKDTGSAAVLMALLNVGLIWLLVLFTR